MLAAVLKPSFHSKRRHVPFLIWVDVLYFHFVIYFLSIATYCKTVVFAGKSASSTLFASNQSKLKEVFSVAPSLCPISPSNSQEPPIRTHPPVGEYKHFSCNQWFYQWSRWTPVSQQLSTLLSSCLVSKHQDCESLHFKCEASSGYLAMLTFYIKKPCSFNSNLLNSCPFVTCCNYVVQISDTENFPIIWNLSLSFLANCCFLQTFANICSLLSL